MKEKALDCLRMARLPIASAPRLAMLATIQAKWSRKAIDVKLGELIERGYIEPLIGNTACGLLTPKGHRALEATESHAEPS